LKESLHTYFTYSNGS